MAEALDETISRQLDLIQHSNTRAVCLAALDILMKLLSNIVGSPEVTKFRSVKKTNKTIQAKLLQCTGILELFAMLGFTPLEDTLVFLGDNTENLELTVAMIEGRMEEMQQAQQAAAQRPPEEAKAAPAKTDYSKLSEEKRRLMEQFELDRRETALRRAPQEGSKGNQLNFGGGKKSCFKDIGVDINKKGG